MVRVVRIKIKAIISWGATVWVNHELTWVLTAVREMYLLRLRVYFTGSSRYCTKTRRDHSRSLKQGGHVCGKAAIKTEQNNKKRPNFALTTIQTNSTGAASQMTSDTMTTPTLHDWCKQQGDWLPDGRDDIDQFKEVTLPTVRNANCDPGRGGIFQTRLWLSVRRTAGNNEKICITRTL